MKLDEAALDAKASLGEPVSQLEKQYNRFVQEKQNKIGAIQGCLVLAWAVKRDSVLQKSRVGDVNLHGIGANTAIAKGPRSELHASLERGHYLAVSQ